MKCVIIASIFVLIQSLSTLGYPQFEIRDGNCSRALVRDLVFQKHVHLSRLPFVTREDKESWQGDYKIYCIIATSEKSADKGSTVDVIEGGLYRPYVTFKLKSSTNHGLEYLLNVYANTSVPISK